MLKNLFHSLAILFIIFGFMWAFSQIPVFQNLEVFNPISQTLDDFDMTDVVFSKLRPALPADERITLVNIGELDRTGIAELLNIIAQHQPRVVGIDAFFRSPKDPQTDSTLQASLAQFNKLVLVSELSSRKFNEKTKQYDSLETSHPLFLEKAQGGYANLSTEGAGNETGFYTCRSFIPATQVKDKGEVLSFGVKLAEQYDPSGSQKFFGP
ncbi:MAG: CHASE2 domain-containing protein [Microscillaceae bacterium]|nr:CHASE2 domain-containing protein [Microscillaceae bacterium]